MNRRSIHPGRIGHFLRSPSCRCSQLYPLCVFPVNFIEFHINFGNPSKYRCLPRTWTASQKKNRWFNGILDCLKLILTIGNAKFSLDVFKTTINFIFVIFNRFIAIIHQTIKIISNLLFGIVKGFRIYSLSFDYYFAFISYFFGINLFRTCSFQKLQGFFEQKLVIGISVAIWIAFFIQGS